jgi:hypothetical protein
MRAQLMQVLMRRSVGEGHTRVAHETSDIAAVHAQPSMSIAMNTGL